MNLAQEFLLKKVTSHKPDDRLQTPFCARGLLCD